MSNCGCNTGVGDDAAEPKEQEDENEFLFPNPYDPESQYPASWRIFFQNEPMFRALFYDPDKLTEYCNTIPPDIAFKIVNQDAEIVYQFDGRSNPIDASYKSAWKDFQAQATPHGRLTRYQEVQNQLKPSSMRRKDARGEYK